MDALVDQGFLVCDDADEVNQVLARLNLGITDSNRLDVFVLPNMNCNFACPYCYEDHRPSQMDAEVEERLRRWFSATAPEFKAVLVSWFGGEPLLSFERLLRLQRVFRQTTLDAGVNFNAHITTNGYLLDERRATALCDAGVLSYQVTMDGPPDIHNRRRVLRGSGDSFERVFTNVCNLVSVHEDANVKLRINFDMETLEQRS